jgi:adenylate kinase family enzyme
MEATFHPMRLYGMPIDLCRRMFKNRTTKESILIRIRIVGACGSGKSTVAKALSKRYSIDFYEMDNLVWDRSVEPQRRFSVEARDGCLAEILERDSWIVEGAHYKWGLESFAKADLIFILKPNRLIRDYRVIRRFVKTRLGLERGNYKQTVRNLYLMLWVWNRDYDREGIHRIMAITGAFADKRVVVTRSRDIMDEMRLRCENAKET